jgi:hypothetical protein
MEPTSKLDQPPTNYPIQQLKKGDEIEITLTGTVERDYFLPNDSVELTMTSSKAYLHLRGKDQAVIKLINRAAPESDPVGTLRNGPEGTAVKTDVGNPPWFLVASAYSYRWRSDAQVADWPIVGSIYGES